MVKNKLIYLVSTLILLAGLILFFLFNNRYSTKTPDGKNFVDKIREENKSGFDSLQNAINHENELNNQIEKNIDTGDFNAAYSLMDSLPPFGKAHSIQLYQGMIYTKQKKYPEAIEAYTVALNEVPYSKAKSMRAEVYVKMNKPELALSDYKSIYEYNYYYSYHIANTFMLMHKKDSALKYYRIYLTHYPNDTIVQQKVKSLNPI